MLQSMNNMEPLMIKNSVFIQYKLGFLQITTNISIKNVLNFCIQIYVGISKREEIGDPCILLTETDLLQMYNNGINGYDF